MEACKMKKIANIYHNNPRMIRAKRQVIRDVSHLRLVTTAAKK